MRMKNFFKTAIFIFVASILTVTVWNCFTAYAATNISMGETFNAYYSQANEGVNLFEYINACYDYPKIRIETNGILNSNRITSNRQYSNEYYSNYSYDDTYVYAMYDDPITLFIDKQYFTTKGDFALFGSSYGFYIHTENVLDSWDSSQYWFKGNLNQFISNVMVFDYNTVFYGKDFYFTPRIILDTQYYTLKSDYNKDLTFYDGYANYRLTKFTNDYTVVPVLRPQKAQKLGADRFNDACSSVKPWNPLLPIVDEGTFTYNPKINLYNIFFKINNFEYFCNLEKSISAKNDTFDMENYKSALKNGVIHLLGTATEIVFDEIIGSIPAIGDCLSAGIDWTKWKIDAYKTLNDCLLESIIHPTISDPKYHYTTSESSAGYPFLNLEFYQENDIPLLTRAESNMINDYYNGLYHAKFDTLQDECEGWDKETTWKNSYVAIDYTSLFGYVKNGKYYFPEKINFIEDKYHYHTVLKTSKFDGSKLKIGNTSILEYGWDFIEDDNFYKCNMMYNYFLSNSNYQIDLNLYTEYGYNSYNYFVQIINPLKRTSRTYIVAGDITTTKTIPLNTIASNTNLRIKIGCIGRNNKNRSKLQLKHLKISIKSNIKPTCS